jgi:chemotaxis response regulator CheB
MADEIMRVLIIDSNITWCYAISTPLNREPDMQVIGKCADNPEAINHRGRTTFSPTRE